MYTHEERKQLLKLGAVSAGSVAVPEGWKLVPIEPTSAMLLAGDTEEYNADIWWSLMLDAAPTAPVAVPKAQPQPSGDFGELDERAEFEKAWVNRTGHERVPGRFPDGGYQFPAAITAWHFWQARAALAQQDAALRAEVLGMVRMLEANEWADHCGKSELGQRLEWAITALQNRLQNIPEIIPESAQQDADKDDS